MEKVEKRYDVALSFAGEDRAYVEALAETLRHRNIKVFYDKYEKTTLWGKDLYAYLSDLYQNRARCCVMFVSKYYTAKLWTNHERKFAQARAFQENTDYILPIRLDNTEIPEIPSTIGYLNWFNETVDTISDAIIDKLKQGPLQIESNLKIFEKTPIEEKLRIATNSRFITIGRSPKSDIQLADKTISWEHGNILLTENEYFYRHVSKNNPTYIKRRHEQILLRQDIRTEIPLKNNDRIVIGNNNILIIQFNLFADFNGYITTQDKEDS